MTTKTIQTYRTLADQGQQGRKSEAIRALCDEVTTLQAKFYNRTTGQKPPSLGEVMTYAKQIGLNGGAPEAYFDHFEAVGWVYGKGRTPIKNWQAAMRTWQRNDKKFNGTPGNGKSDPPATWNDYLRTNNLSYSGDYRHAPEWMRLEHARWQKRKA